MCEEAGEGEFCGKLLERLERDEISTDQFVEELSKNEKVSTHLQLRKEPQTAPEEPSTGTP